MFRYKIGRYMRANVRCLSLRRSFRDWYRLMQPAFTAFVYPLLDTACGAEMNQACTWAVPRVPCIVFMTLVCSLYKPRCSQRATAVSTNLHVPSMALRTVVARYLERLFSHCLLATRIYRFFWTILEVVGDFTWVPIPRLPTLYRKYTSALEADLYWAAARRSSRTLEASNSNDTANDLSLLVYYSPKLLPGYRERMLKDPEAREEYISPKTFCKWHRMVFPGPVRSIFHYDKPC